MNAFEHPYIVFDDEPGLADFAEFAWACAEKHITQCPGAPQSPYMDEAFAPDRIWIWDTCFMALYCKYAPAHFPGIESLQNFYAVMLDGKTDTPLRIHIPDNPPLFAWAEYEYWHLTGDRAHIDRVFRQKRYPQRMFELFEAFRYGQTFPYMTSVFPVQWEKCSMGYHWSGGRCGMDNTPRGDFPRSVMDNNPAYRKILFLDAACQQALSARIIYEITGESAFHTAFEDIAKLVNDFYWDEETQCYYDIEAAAPHRLVKVMTPASFWPLLAKIAPAERAAAMAKHAADPSKLGGDVVPFPSVSYDSPYFDPAGGYWRGGVWLPTAYMALRALDGYGFQALSMQLGERILRHQFRTWKNFAPHTIWECYAPTEPKPASGKSNAPFPSAKPDFCGWSALGPINIAVESLLGIQADGVEHKILWRIHHACRHGIRNLQFGGIRCSMIFEHGVVSGTASAPFLLEINGQRLEVSAPGSFAFRL